MITGGGGYGTVKSARRPPPGCRSAQRPSNSMIAAAPAGKPRSSPLSQPAAARSSGCGRRPRGPGCRRRPRGPSRAGRRVRRHRWRHAGPAAEAPPGGRRSPRRSARPAPPTTTRRRRPVQPFAQPAADLRRVLAPAAGQLARLIAAARVRDRLRVADEDEPPRARRSSGRIGRVVTTASCPPTAPNVRQRDPAQLLSGGDAGLRGRQAWWLFCAGGRRGRSISDGAYSSTPK